MWTVPSSAVYSYSTLIRFALSLCFAGSFLRRGCRLSFLCVLLYGAYLPYWLSSRLLSASVNQWHNNLWNGLWEGRAPASASERGNERALASELVSSAVYFYLRSSYGDIFIPLIHYVWEIGFFMFEILVSLWLRYLNCLFNTLVSLWLRYWI
jgi:hypothetical protein